MVERGCSYLLMGQLRGYLWSQSSVMESWMEPLGPEHKQELKVGGKEEFLLLLHFHIFLDGLFPSFLEFLGLGKSPLVHF